MHKGVIFSNRKSVKYTKVCQAFKQLSMTFLVFGKTMSENDQNLTNAMNRVQQKNVCFNPERVGITEVPFFGHIIRSSGLKLDSIKIKAIAKIPIPSSPEKLETFLGMVNYLAKFASNLAEVTAPLRILLKKKSDFIQDEAQSRSFNQVKEIITTVSVLEYFDTN